MNIYCEFFFKNSFEPEIMIHKKLDGESIINALLPLSADVFAQLLEDEEIDDDNSKLSLAARYITHITHVFDHYTALGAEFLEARYDDTIPEVSLAILEDEEDDTYTVGISSEQDEVLSMHIINGLAVMAAELLSEELFDIYVSCLLDIVMNEEDYEYDDLFQFA